MKEKFFVRLFAESEAGVVQNIIHRGLREINGKDYPAELIEEYKNFIAPRSCSESSSSKIANTSPCVKCARRASKASSTALRVVASLIK